MSDFPKKQLNAIFGVPEIDHDIATAYQRLSSTVRRLFGERVWFMTEACLSVILCLTQRDVRNPIGLNLVDGPSSEKTTVLSFFYGLPMVYRSDDFTPSSFVTQAANVKRKDAEKIDLLPRIKDKCLMVPELAPLFSLDSDELTRSFGMLTRVFDGEGLCRDGAVQGRRSYEGEYMFTWLGATTPPRPHIWRLMGNLGSRFLFLTLDARKSQSDDVADAIAVATDEHSYGSKVDDCRTALAEYFDAVCQRLPRGEFAKTVDPDRLNDDSVTISHIGELAALTARIRSEVQSSRGDSPSDAQEADFQVAVVERPMRLMTVLMAVARGHAIAQGRRYIAPLDLPLIVALALSSMPDDRRKVINLLAETQHPHKSSSPGTVTSTEVTDLLCVSRVTAIKTLNVLSALGVGSLSRSGNHEPLTLELDSCFRWIATDEFVNLRDGWRSDESFPQ